MDHDVSNKMQDVPTTASAGVYTVRRAHGHEIALLPDIERSAGAAFRAYPDIARLADDEPMPVEVLGAYAEAGHLWVAVLASSPLEGRGTIGANTNKSGKDGEEVVMMVVGFLAAFPIINNAGNGSGSGRTRAQKRRSLGAGAGSAYLHIAELSVHAAHQKRGLGKMLLETMVEDVRASPFVAVGMPGRGDDADEGMPTQQQQIGIRGLSLTTFKHLAFNAPFYARMGFREVSVDGIEDVVGTRGWELWKEEQGGILRPEMRCWMVRDL
jgi:GNAT superfamily N-acetyltransferase